MDDIITYIENPTENLFFLHQENLKYYTLAGIYFYPPLGGSSYTIQNFWDGEEINCLRNKGMHL